MALFIITLASAIAALFLSRFLRSFFFTPWSARRALLSQGFHVLPYFPIFGDLPRIKRLQSCTQLSPIPSPSHHHLLFPYLFPFFHRHFSAHGDGAPLVFWWGTHPTVVITDPDDAKCAMSADVKRFDRSQVFLFFRPLLGNGVLLLDGAQWQHHRDILRPAFFSDKLKDMVIHMTRSAMDMIRAWEKQVAMAEGNSVEIEVAKPIKDTTADILSRTLFGSTYLRGKAVFEMQIELLRLLIHLRAWISAIPGFRFLPTRDNRRLAELEKKINVELGKLVESRLYSGNASAEEDLDMLGLIVEAEAEEAKKMGSELARQRIIDECKTFFFAGHETTAGLLAWTMVLLAENEEWQEKAREEAMEVCGGEDLRPEELSRLKIMGMVLNETLRLYPPTPEFGRRVTNPSHNSFQLRSRLLPKGTTIVVETLYIHRRKDIWGDDADQFNPQRFSDGVANACKHPYGFLPFGIGPRHCIGQHFAMLEAKVILTLILQHFKFRLSPNYVHAPFTAITMRPKHGVQLILQPLTMDT